MDLTDADREPYQRLWNGQLAGNRAGEADSGDEQAEAV
jgi:hypothetical protein